MARTGQVSGRVPRAIPTCAPSPSWSPLDWRMRSKIPSAVKRMSSRSSATSSERRSPPRETGQQQCPVAQARQTGQTRRDRRRTTASSWRISVEVNAAAGRTGRFWARRMPRITVVITGSADDQRWAGRGDDGTPPRPGSVVTRCARACRRDGRGRRRRSPAAPADTARGVRRTMHGRPPSHRHRFFPVAGETECWAYSTAWASASPEHPLRPDTRVPAASASPGDAGDRPARHGGRRRAVRGIPRPWHVSFHDNDPPVKILLSSDVRPYVDRHGNRDPAP